MIYKKELLLVLVCFVISSCNINEYKQFKIDNGKYYFTYNQDIPSSLQEKINSMIGQSSYSDNSKKSEINIIKYELRTYDIYSGSALRALEKEIKATISFNVKSGNSMNMDHSMHMSHSMHMDHSMDIKSVNIMKRFSAIELNPLADNEMTKFMESEALNDLIDQLIIEVSLIDL